MSWDTTSPLGSDFISLGDNEIRTLKTDIQTSLRANAATGTEAIFPGSDVSNPVFRYRGLKGTTGARPAFGEYGLYANTSTSTLQRDSGSAWEDVATLIPSGTKMPFYQASPPTGWTAVAVNDKFIRVVTSGGTGGTNGGSLAASSDLAHTHTTPNHVHELARDSSTNTAAALGSGGHFVATSSPFGSGTQDLNVFDRSGGALTRYEVTDHTGSDGSGTSGSTAIGTFAYADFCVGTRD